MTIAHAAPTSLVIPATRAVAPTHTGYEIACRHALVVTLGDVRYFADRMQKYADGDATIRMWFDNERWTDFTLTELDEDDLGVVTKLSIFTPQHADGRVATLTIDAGVTSVAKVAIEGPEHGAAKLHSRIRARLGKMKPVYSALAQQTIGIIGVFTGILALLAWEEGTNNIAWACGLLTLLVNPVTWPRLFPSVAFRIRQGEQTAKSAGTIRVAVFTIVLGLLTTCLSEFLGA